MNLTAAETYRFSVEEYHRLGEAGIFHEDDRVELLSGNLVLMAPIGIRHMKAVRRLTNLLVKRYGSQCVVDVQNPVMIDGESEPQPDLLLLRAEADDRDSAPLPQDVLLLVEVADSSLQYDRSDKRRAYARNGIAEYWILDLTRDELEIFREPAGDDYRSITRARRDEAVAPLAFTEISVLVRDLLPA
jgi:Uma2 family endonuclease